MEEMDKKEIKDVIEWCDEKGHSEHEILELIRRIVGANPREEEKYRFIKKLMSLQNEFVIISSYVGEMSLWGEYKQ